MAKKWCEHIKFKPYIIRQYVLMGDENTFDLAVDDDFKFCPICGKPRPKEVSNAR